VPRLTWRCREWSLIFYRFEVEEVYANASKCSFSAAKLGGPVVYKGIDLLIVDLEKENIESVYTSADYIREITQKGFPLG
jgi:hypothetical protein